MQKTDCTRNCWIAGAVIGLLVWIFTSGIGQTSFMGGLFLGLITAVLMGLFLVWALCSGAGSAEDGRHDGRVRATLTHPGDAPASAAKPVHLAPRSEAPPAPATPSAAPATPKAAPKPAPVPATAPAAAATSVAAAAPAASAPPAKKADPKPEPVATPAKAEPAKAKPEAAKPETAKPETAKAEKAKPVAAKPEKTSAEQPNPAETKPAKPKAAAKPARKAAAKPDDLKEIKGVGPKLEQVLHENGVTQFAQIAEWDDAQIDSFAEKIGSMGGRIRSDDWVAQAKILAAGGETEFSARVDKGDVY